MEEKHILSGVIFRTSSGRPVDRSNICHEMKKLGENAKVDERKIFPHNLRHLFARKLAEADTGSNESCNIVDIILRRRHILGSSLAD